MLLLRAGTDNPQRVLYRLFMSGAISRYMLVFLHYSRRGYKCINMPLLWYVDFFYFFLKRGELILNNKPRLQSNFKAADAQARTPLETKPDVSSLLPNCPSSWAIPFALRSHFKTLRHWNILSIFFFFDDVVLSLSACTACTLSRQSDSDQIGPVKTERALSYAY